MLEDLSPYLETPEQQETSRPTKRRHEQTVAEGLQEVASDAEAGAKTRRTRAAPKDGEAKKPRPGGRNYQPKAPAQLAGYLAKGLKFTTVVGADTLGLDRYCVMTLAEAQAIADPASRLLWPYLRHMKLLQRMMATAEKNADAVALLMAMYAYANRVGAQVFEAYQIKLRAVRAQQAQQQQTRQHEAEVRRHAGQPVQNGATVEYPSDGRVNGHTTGAGVPGGHTGSDVPTNWGGGAFPASFEPWSPLQSSGLLEPSETWAVPTLPGNG